MLLVQDTFWGKNSLVTLWDQIVWVSMLHPIGIKKQIVAAKVTLWLMVNAESESSFLKLGLLAVWIYCTVIISLGFILKWSVREFFSTIEVFN